MAKHAFYYRCARRLKRKGFNDDGTAKQCGGRRSLPKRIEEYVREPKCPSCGATGMRLDKYRHEHERGKRAPNCDCDGLPYRHRSGSKWCRDYKGKYDEIDMMYRPMERST